MPASDRTQRLDWLVAAALVLLAAASFCLRFDDAGFGRPDAYDYAQMGRELRTGHGFATLQIFPRHVPYLAESGLLDRAHWPNLHRYPLPTLLNAAAQLVERDVVRAAVLQCGIAFALSVGVAFLLARRVVGLSAALVAALLVASDPLVFESSSNGMSEAAAILLALVAFRVALAPAPGLARAGVVGLLCGLAVLLRTQLAVLLPLACLQLALASPKRRALAAALVALVAAAAVAPWAARNLALTGEPMFSFSSSRNLAKPIHPDPDMDLHAPVATRELLAARPGALRGKLAESLTQRLPSPTYWLQSLGGAAAVAVVVLLASFAWRRSGPPAADALRLGALLFLAANFAALCITFHTERFYAVPRVLLVVAAVCELALAAERGTATPTRRRLVAACAATLALLAVARYAGLAREYAERAPRPSAAPEPRAWALLARDLPPGAIVASDQSERVALHAGRRSVRIPLDPAQLLELDERYLRIDYVVLGPAIEGLGTPRQRVPIAYRKYRAWAGFTRSPAFERRFRRERRLPNGLVVYARRD
jgi:hypothetical protein